MDFVWLTAVKDWRRQRRNPIEMVVWLGIPLLMGGLIILAFGGRGGPQPQAHLLIADEDDSFLSGFLIGALSQEEAGQFVHHCAVAVTALGRGVEDRQNACQLCVCGVLKAGREGGAQCRAERGRLKEYVGGFHA